MLYSLSLFNERHEGFFVGLFPSCEEARQTAEHYLSAVPGFRDYPCTYEITEKSVIGTAGPSQTVHMIWGWDEDADGTETGIWSSGCYANEQDAQRALNEARQRMKKQMWSLDAYRIGQCHWTEGFVRLADSKRERCPDEQPLLPRGITGFWGADTEPPPLLDEQVFRRMCHALARESGGTVAEVDTDTSARNFYFAEIRRYDASIFLLQNIHYPYAAFARRDPSGGFAWTSRPEWLRLPEDSARILGPDELTQDWRGLCGELSTAELEQIRYWNPQTAGEIIFNAWD